MHRSPGVLGQARSANLEVQLTNGELRYPIRGGEIRLDGQYFRIAPFGNHPSTNPYSTRPHYHYRVIDPATGETMAGQSHTWHRPWEPNAPGTSLWDRLGFFK